MRFFLSFFLVSSSFFCFSQLTDDQIHDLKGGRVKEDTSYVYWLPYASGKRYLLVQASNSTMSHKNELSADFKMKTGEVICAAREGIIIDFRSDSDRGGLHEENLADGNFVKVQHN